jgi:hypothetical protein
MRVFCFESAVLCVFAFGSRYSSLIRIGTGIGSLQYQLFWMFRNLRLVDPKPILCGIEAHTPGQVRLDITSDNEK